MDIVSRKKLEKTEATLQTPNFEHSSENLESPETLDKEGSPVREEKLSETINVSQSKSDIGEPGIDTSKSPLHQEIESILESDLEDVYFSLDEQHQEMFRSRGEETASHIIKLLETGKATLKKIIKLISNWLKVIPGVSKFFVAQEAKIKADKILEINK